MSVEKRFPKETIKNGKIRIICKNCNLEKWAKVISKYVQECQGTGTNYETWKEERAKVRVLPHQRGKGQCSGSNKTQESTIAEIVWV